LSESTYAWLAIFIYVGLGIGVAVLAKRQLGQGMNEFFLANRQLGGFVAAMTYAATTYSAFMMVAISLLTVAPVQKAEDFIGYINQNLSKYKFV
jgi:SSS family solute:Na+ symporter